MLLFKCVKCCCTVTSILSQVFYHSTLEVTCSGLLCCFLIILLFCLWFFNWPSDSRFSQSEWASFFCRERETPPRFAQPGSFEFEYSQRWKSLDEMEKQQREQVAKNMKDAKDKLESEMEDAYHEHQANLLRQGNWLWILDHLFAFSARLNGWLMVSWINSCFLC